MHHNRMKRSFAFLLTMAMLLSLCLGAAGAQYPCVGFAARKLTVTRSASATGETLYTVPAATPCISPVTAAITISSSMTASRLRRQVRRAPGGRSACQ